MRNCGVVSLLFLKRDWHLHNTTVDYWTMRKEDFLEGEEDVFPIKFLMRPLWQEMESTS